MIGKLTMGHWPYFILNSISSLGNIFLPLVLVRLLGPDEVGQYKIFYLYLMALPFLFMTGGPGHSVFYWVGKSGEEKSKALNATWLWTLLLSGFILIIGWPLRHYISNQTGLPLENVSALLLAGALWCPSGHYSESSLAHGRASRGPLFDSLFEFIKTMGFIFIAWKWKDIGGIFYFHAALMLIKLLMGFALNKWENNIGLETGLREMKKVFLYFLPVSLAGCLGFFVDKLDLLVLSAFLAPQDFAFYSMGCLIIPPLLLLEMSVQKVLIPELSKFYSEKKFSEASASFRKAIKNISYLILPATFGLITFADPIISLLYTDQYAQSGEFLKVFALSYLLLCLPHDSVPRASGKTSWILKMYLVLTPISLALGLITARYFDAMAVLMVGITLKCLPKLYGLNYSRVIMRWSWQEMFPMKELMQYSVLALGLSFISILLRDFFTSELNWFLICAPIFTLTYLGVLNFMTSSPEALRKNPSGSIVLFAPGPMGGAEKVVLIGQKTMQEQGLNSQLWIIHESRVPKVFHHFDRAATALRVKYKLLSCHSVFDLRLLLELRRNLRQDPPALIHAHGMKSAVYAWLSTPPGCKLIITHHGRTSHSLKVRLYEFIELQILRRAHGVIAVSGQMKESLRLAGIKDRNLFVLENFLTLRPVEKIHRQSQALKLVFIGRLSPEKGCDTLIKALSLCQEKYHLSVLGEGREREKLKSLTKKLGLSQQVKFHGHKEDVIPYLMRADALVMPSLREGQPLALIEASCLGIPVVATKVGGIPELIEDGKNGLLCPPNDPQKLAHCLDELSKNQSYFSTTAYEYKNKMQKRFAPETWAQKTQSFYESVLIQS